MNIFYKQKYIRMKARYLSLKYNLNGGLISSCIYPVHNIFKNYHTMTSIPTIPALSDIKILHDLDYDLTLTHFDPIDHSEIIRQLNKIFTFIASDVEADSIPLHLDSYAIKHSKDYKNLTSGIDRFIFIFHKYLKLYHTVDNDDTYEELGTPFDYHTQSQIFNFIIRILKNIDVTYLSSDSLSIYSLLDSIHSTFSSGYTCPTYMSYRDYLTNIFTVNNKLYVKESFISDI